MSSFDNCACCCVFNCLYNEKPCGQVALFKLPDNQEQCMVWLKTIHRLDLIEKDNNDYRICELHFKDTDIISSAQSISKKILKKTAIPCLCLPIYIKSETTDILIPESETYCNLGPNKPFAPVCHNVETQTHINLTNTVDTQTTASLGYTLPVVRELKEQIRIANTEIRQLKNKEKLGDRETFLRLCDKFLPENFSELVKLQLSEKSNSRGNRYSPEFKSRCLKAFENSPGGYKALKKILYLPSEKTLKRDEKNKKMSRDNKAKSSDDDNAEGNNYSTVSLDTNISD